jgi:hypothetical protein
MLKEFRIEQDSKLFLASRTWLEYRSEFFSSFMIWKI